MNRTISLTLDAAELHQARCVVLAADPVETDLDHGVVVTWGDGRRSWTAWSHDAIATADPVDVPSGDHDEAHGQLLVPRRLVEFAAHLAGADTVVLATGSDGLTISTESMVIGFRSPIDRWSPSAISPHAHDCARATVQTATLLDLFGMGRVLPAGVDLEAADSIPFRLDIDEHGISAAVDWTTAGAAATSWLVPALDTNDSAGAAHVSPAGLRHILSLADATDVTTLAIPPSADCIEVSVDGWTARLAARSICADSTQFTQLELPFVGAISVKGGLRPDPLAGAGLADVRAFAIDPDVATRVHAAASRWNWDVRVQQSLAADPDERVVLALLDHVDPGVEACDLIIDGPHVAARRVLAARNLLTPLLQRLANDDDPVTAELARRTLATRPGAPTPAASR